MNSKPTGFAGFINQTEMVSFSSFIRQIGWLFVVILFSVTASIIMLRDGHDYMTWGFQLAGAVLGALTLYSGIGAFNTKTVRESAKEYAPVAEAKERGKVAGAAAAAVIKEQALDAAAIRANGTTKERPAVEARNVKNMTVNAEPDDERGSE